METGCRARVKARVKRFLAMPNLYSVSLLMVITMFLFADQNLMAPNLTLIANEFGFDEFERDQKLGGDISLAFFLIGGGSSVFVGCLIDKVHRIRLYALCVFLGELSCFATFWVTTYTQLFWLRALTGVAIGGAMPNLFALLGDFFPTGQRAKSSSLAGTAMAVGIGIGQLAAGFMQSCCGWRTPFLAVGSPSLVLCVLLIFTVKEPARGAQETHTDRDRSHTLVSQSDDAEESETEESGVGGGGGGRSGAARQNQRYQVALKEALRTPSILLIGLQGLPGSVPWGILLAFFNDYLIADMKLSPEIASFVIIIFGIGSLTGLIAGGVLGDWLLVHRGAAYVGFLMSSSTLLATALFYALINVQWGSAYLYTLVSFPSGLLASVTGANVKGMLIEVTLPEIRGAVFAGFNLMDDLGKGLGPFIIASIISATGSRVSGFNYALLGWIFSSAIHFMLSFTLARDRARVIAADVISLETIDLSTRPSSSAVHPSSPKSGAFARLETDS